MLARTGCRRSVQQLCKENQVNSAPVLDPPPSPSPTPSPPPRPHTHPAPPPPFQVRIALFDLIDDVVLQTVRSRSEVACAHLAPLQVVCTVCGRGDKEDELLLCDACPKSVLAHIQTHIHTPPTYTHFPPYTHPQVIPRVLPPPHPGLRAAWTMVVPRLRGATTPLRRYIRCHVTPPSGCHLTLSPAPTAPTPDSNLATALEVSALHKLIRDHFPIEKIDFSCTLVSCASLTCRVRGDTHPFPRQRNHPSPTRGCYAPTSAEATTSFACSPRATTVLPDSGPREWSA